MTADAQNPGPKRPGRDQSATGQGAGQEAGRGADQARPQELSRKLLDLWQDHLSAVAQDPDLLAQALKLMSAAPFAWMPGFPAHGGAGFAQPANTFPFGNTPPAAEAGAAPVAAAPAAGADDLGQLRRRLAELEGRLGQLEGAKAGSSRGASGAGSPGKLKPGARKPRRRPAKS